jgi:hypothetical protein
MSALPSENPSSPDWNRIELDYRAGVKSVRQIGQENGVSHTAINKRAKQFEWDRDLSAKVKAKADRLVSTHEVSTVVSSTTAPGAAETTMAKLTEKVIVDASASVLAGVRLSHRRSINRAMNLHAVLMGELEVVSNPEGVGLIESLMDVLAKPTEDETPAQWRERRKRQSDMLDKVLGVAGRVDTLKRAVETQRMLIELERQAFNLTDKTPEDGAAGPQLSDSDRASRMAAILARGMSRRASEATDAVVKPAKAADAA